MNGKIEQRGNTTLSSYPANVYYPIVYTQIPIVLCNVIQNADTIGIFNPNITYFAPPRAGTYDWISVGY